MLNVGIVIFMKTTPAGKTSGTVNLDAKVIDLETALQFLSLDKVLEMARRAS